ncbi:MAG: hypothetical protein UT63_C0036G0005 [Candidatus Gottesmanbacteria bacterium GW2011_GWC2_39_8]|uniref:MalT-like TPR region domain-containing protein n=1 Tax=Candidatus Gottesmanbacteria bacterium GW2011_GWC2_39_8 TaxID=1618450 RepID=A0A0G0Q5N9_9BACT|nr:MAG: hypothetical protein UT63_C0036G0005 [Candidatus Gottesmanbacteria bacterium GW2011_GWC2_39_8]
MQKQAKIPVSGPDIEKADEALKKGNYGTVVKLLQTPAGEPETNIHALLILAKAGCEQGNYKLAAKHLRNVLKLLKKTKNPILEASYYEETGRLSDHESKFNDAKKFLEKSLKIYTKTADKSGEMRIYHVLAYIYSMEGEYDRAREYFDEAIVREQSLKNEYFLSHTLHALGRLYSGNLHDFSGLTQTNKEGVKKAFGYFKQSLGIAKKLGDARQVAHTTGMMGFILYKEGKFKEAKKEYNESLKISRKLGLKLNEERIIYELAKIYLKEGDTKTAVKYLKESAKMAFKLTDLFGLVRINYELGTARKDKKLITSAQKLAKKIGDKKAVELLQNSLKA